jgi:hypothetical protein
MKKLPLFILALVLLSQCQNKRPDELSFKPLSDYKIDSSAAKNGDKLTLLALSGANNIDDDAVYYSKFLAVNETSRDTILILCPLLKFTSPESSIENLYILPIEFSSDKKVSTASFLKSNDYLNLIFKTFLSVDESDFSTGQAVEHLQRTTGQKKELVVENTSMDIFNRTYKTTIGILDFDTDPR